jgi:branched-chain amino acid transport system substrate-binding protein
MKEGGMKRLYIFAILMIGFGMILPNQTIAQAKPILIGDIAGFTGVYSVMMNQQKDAVEMAVAEINEAGGLLGRQVKVINEDSMSNASIATRKLERLILEEKVDFIIGSDASTIVLAWMEIDKKYNKILITSIAQSVKITGENRNKQTFRTCANPTITSGGLCKWMTANLGKKYYLLTVDYVWGRDTSEQYHKTLTKMGANIVGETYFPMNTKDFAPYFGKIKAAKPDVLFITAAGNDAISVVTQAEQYGIKKMMHICGDGSLVAADILKTQGDAANGIITSDYYAASLDTPENRDFVAKVKKLYGYEVSKFFVSSYEAVMWLAQAIKKAGSVDTDKVIAALEGSTYHGPQGIKTMDPDSHQTSLTVYMIKVENGQLKIFAKVD